MSRAKTSHHLPRFVRSGSKRRKFIALVALLALLVLVVRYPVETADLVTTVVGGFTEFFKALSA